MLKEGGIFYSSFIAGDFEGIKESKEYPGTKKFWAFYRPNELEKIFVREGFKKILLEAKKPVVQYHKSPWLHLLYQK